MKERIIRQHDQRDCGPACLSTVARYHGLRYSMPRVREFTKTDRSGTNIYGLVDAGTQMGFACQALSGTAEELQQEIDKKQIPFPFIAHIVSAEGTLHFVVVFRQISGGFVIGDPGKGKYVLTREQFAAAWTGHIVTFEKTRDFRPGKHTRNSLLGFFSLLKGQYRRLGLIILTSLLVSGIGISGAFLFQLLLNTAAPGAAPAANQVDSGLAPLGAWLADSAGRLDQLFAGLVCLYLLQGVIQWVRGLLVVRVAKTVDLRISLMYYRHLLDLPVSSVNVLQTGEYLSRFSDAGAIRDAISQVTLTIFLDMAMVIGCGVVLYLENSRMFLVAMGMAGLFAAVALGYRKAMERSNRRVMERTAAMESYLKESIDGVETVKATCAGETVKARGEGKFLALWDALVPRNLIAISQDVIATTVEAVGTILILWIGFRLTLAGQISVGSLITFYVLLTYFSQPIQNLLKLQPTVQTALVSADRLNDILDQSVEENTRGTAPVEDFRDCALEHVNFRYGNKELVLEDVSLTVRRGEKVAIVGESGSGKSTLAKLLVRFYDPEAGRILLNGRETGEYNLTALRNSITYVSQSTFLFSDTIRNNLKLGCESVTDEDMIRACKASHADEFIDRLPMGYDTPLDEGGMNLSGGQRQRLALARAILRRSQLVILDEATSSLDTITENAIRDTIFRYDPEASYLIIAHRLSTVRNCDRIYVMHRGRIVEEGTHETLLANNRYYKALWDAQ
ncbi:MAG: peptidase domain-containing ABC transporter [Ruminiclostridium sp.]|nr:peptidase domain-containing ABC transporter [Ruminiclostridium sp.]